MSIFRHGDINLRKVDKIEGELKPSRKEKKFCLKLQGKNIKIRKRISSEIAHQILIVLVPIKRN